MKEVKLKRTLPDGTVEEVTLPVRSKSEKRKEKRKQREEEAKRARDVLAEIA